MKVSKFTVNPFGENVYLLWNESSKNVIIVDPGMMNETERNAVTNFIESKELKPQRLLLTHVHIDHAASAAMISLKYGLKVEASEEDEFLAAQLPEQAKRFGLKINPTPLSIDEYLTEKSEIALDDEKIKVLRTPGHTPGALAFYIPDSAIVLVGDSVFLGSIGRTDLPGGSEEQLIDSIKTKILTLPDETVICPGHGPTTTVRDEKSYNPFIQ